MDWASWSYYYVRCLPSVITLRVQVGTNVAEKEVSIEFFRLALLRTLKALCKGCFLIPGGLSTGASSLHICESQVDDRLLHSLRLWLMDCLLWFSMLISNKLFIIISWHMFVWTWCYLYCGWIASYTPKLVATLAATKYVWFFHDQLRCDHVEQWEHGILREPMCLPKASVGQSMIQWSVRRFVKNRHKMPW